MKPKELCLLDVYKRQDIDPACIGVNGGSGGGTQTVLLTVLDDRFTAAAPVVSLASHFDGDVYKRQDLPLPRAVILSSVRMA